MRTLLALAVVLLVLPIPVAAEPPAPMEDRIKILTVEMNRGPAEDLAPFLTEDAHHLSRWYALRALGRIGDRGKAPEMLAAFLESGIDTTSALWVAGIAQTDKLFDPIAMRLKSDDPGVVGAAAEALGWTKKGKELLLPLLESEDERIREGALMGLARIRDEATLEAVVALVDDESEHVRRAADFASWLIAGARKRDRTAPPKEGEEKEDEEKGSGPVWDGEPSLLPIFLKELAEDDPARRLAAVRVLGSLLPSTITRDGNLDIVFGLAKDPDPRVTQEAVSRIFTSREGDPVDRFLVGALNHRDPKVRSGAATALTEPGTGPAKNALLTRFDKETDLRVKDDIALALAKMGDLKPFRSIEIDVARAKNLEPVYRDMTRAQVLLLSEDPKDLGVLLRWITPGALESGDVHPLVVMTVIDGLKENEDERILPWLRGFIEGEGPFDFDDPYVAATAVGALAAGKHYDALGELCKGEASRETHGEVRLEMTKTFGAAAKNDDVPSELKTQMTRWLRDAMTSDDSAWVQDASRSALEGLEEEVPPRDFLKATDWRGLPRPSGTLMTRLGLPMKATEDAWIHEDDILRIADVLFGVEPKVVFETTQGTFKVELDPDQAPVHCVALVLSVANGTYANTRWHRVVPSFVIQGGDPHGHGSGNSGYFIPDEITTMSYERGVLGMPKSRKDDGGCQLFFMHSPYIPLDGRYSAYGKVVEGMDVVDQIRVGDRIIEARLEFPE